MLLIDYEYAGWNPMAMDLANWINETMLDNSYPEKNGIAWYTQNIMDTDEVRMMIETYLGSYYEKYMKTEIKQQYDSQKDFIVQNLDEFTAQVWNCCLLNNLFWGVWSISLLKP